MSFATQRDDRRFERFEVDGEVELKVILTRSTDVMEVKARLKNAGTGGLFVETKDDVPVGALADLNLRLEGGPLANTLGLIRYVKKGEGAGIEFFYATDEERDALERYLDAWGKRRRASRQRPAS
jgi:hypothetical protein